MHNSGVELVGEMLRTTNKKDFPPPGKRKSLTIALFRSDPVMELTSPVALSLQDR
jgi:hypothetical protein